MSLLLLCMAGYIVLDRLITVGSVGKSIDITPGFAVVSLLTGAFFVTVLIIAGTQGVTP